METITFANEAYIPVVANWLAGMRKIKRKSVVVYTLDDATKRFVENSGFEARSVHAEDGIGPFWQMRIRVFRNLIMNGTTFVHSDSDAVWLRNLPKTIFGNEDICFSQGTTHPPNVFKTTGFVVCCGLFMAKASNSSQAFFDLLLQNVQRTADDQRSVNNVLQHQGVDWVFPKDHYITHTKKGTALDCWQSPVRGTCKQLNMSVRMLPHWAVQRAEDQHPRAADAYVKHYLSPKTPAGKLKMFAKHGLLMLKDDWHTVQDAKSLDDLIRAQ